MASPGPISEAGKQDRSRSHVKLARLLTNEEVLSKLPNFVKSCSGLVLTRQGRVRHESCAGAHSIVEGTVF